LADTVADNASCGRVVVGARRGKPGDCDLRLVGMVMEKNGEVVATGADAAVLGNRANAVAWLANKMSELGEPLRAKEMVLPRSRSCRDLYAQR
jgi:2-keto-4-pentenoate hydratase